MSEVKWKRAHRARLHVFGAPEPCDPKPMTHPASDAWSLLASIVSKPLRVTVEADEALEEKLARVVTQHRDQTAPEQWDPAVEHVRAAYVFRGGVEKEAPPAEWDDWGDARALMALWMGAAGVDATLRILLAPPSFKVMRQTLRTPTETTQVCRLVSLPPGPPSSGFQLRQGGAPGIYEPLWWALRLHVNALTEDELAAATATAREHLERLDDGDWWPRFALAFAFAREPAIVQQVTAELHAYLDATEAPQHTYGSTLLMLAQPSFDAAMRIFERLREAHGTYARDFVSMFGTDAEPFVQTMATDPSQPSYLRNPFKQACGLFPKR
jgi:hypothetical protein